MRCRTFSLSIAKLCLLAAVLQSVLTSCGSTSSSDGLTVVHTRGFQPNHGPFDSKGNYIEAWADKPPKRRYVTAEQFAKLDKNDRRSTKPVKPSRPTTELKPLYPSEPKLLASTALPKAPTSQPTRKKRPSTSSYTKPSKPKYTPPKRKATASKAKSKPKKRVTAKAVKPKAKPPIVHKVKKGDTLYGLSRKYKTTIGGIQRANKLESTHIGIGDRLIIPRK